MHYRHLQYVKSVTYSYMYKRAKVSMSLLSSFIQSTYSYLPDSPLIARNLCGSHISNLLPLCGLSACALNTSCSGTYTLITAITEYLLI